MPFYPTSSAVGADFNNASDSAQFGAGNTALGSNDTLWVYCETVGTFSTGMMGAITTSGTATPCVTSGGTSVANSNLGFIQTSSTSGQFAWFCQKGNNVYIRVSGTVNASAVLYVATTSGLLHSTSASGTLGGVVMLASTSATATTQAVLANLTWPKFITSGQ